MKNIHTLRVVGGKTLFALICSLALMTVQAAASDRVGADVAARIASNGHATVMVALDMPATVAKHGTKERNEAIARVADAVLGALPAGSYTLRHRFETVAALSLDIDAAALQALRSVSGIRRVDLDVGGHAHMLQSAPLAHVDSVRALGYIGSGIKVAVIDSGVDLAHPDLASRIVGQQCYCSGATSGTGCCPDGTDVQGGAGSGMDAEGHGTNVAGILGGSGANAPQGGAPNVSMLAVRVLDENGAFRTTADIVAALDWISAHHPDTRVVNMSLGTNMLFAGNCDNATSWTMALADAVATLDANGTVITVSSGNQGSNTMIAAPACLSHVIAVGATWDASMGNQNFLGCIDTGIVARKPTCFTNSNDRVALYAPGAYLTSTGLAGGPFTTGFVSTYGGTSQASPLVASCVADMLQLRPTASPATIRSALVDSDQHVMDPKNGLTFPFLDCLDAMIRVDRVFAGGFDG